MPKRRAASRWLSPSTWQAWRTLPYSSTENIPRLPARSDRARGRHQGGTVWHRRGRATQPAVSEGHFLTAAYTWQALGEDRAGAGGVGAAQAADPHPQLDDAAPPGQVGEAADIDAVPFVGQTRAGWAWRRVPARSGDEDDVFGAGQQPVDGEAGRNERVDGCGQRRSDRTRGSEPRSYDHRRLPLRSPAPEVRKSR